MKTEFRGKLVYAGKGRLGVITKYFYEEGVDGEPIEKWTVRIVKTKIETETTTKPTMIQGVRYAYGEKTLFVEIKARGQYYPGYAILSPTDTKDNSFGKRLAIARAMGDAEAIVDLLDEDFAATYIEEYGEDEDESDEDESDETAEDEEEEDSTSRIERAYDDDEDEVEDDTDEESTEEFGEDEAI